MNIRIRQIEKAKRMINTGMVKNKVLTADFVTYIKETADPQFETCFTAVTNAFLDIGKTADCASMAVANLIPNIRKRG